MLRWQAIVTVFSQMVIGVSFAASVAGKLKDPSGFVQAVTDTRLASASWATGIAQALLAAEAVVVALLALGMTAAGTWAVTAGLAGGFLLLVGYTVALTTMRVRGLRVACHCFGPSATRVSWYDVTRNGLLMLAAGAGLAAAADPTRLPPVDTLLVGTVGLAAALILVNFTDVMETTVKPVVVD